MRDHRSTTLISQAQLPTGIYLLEDDPASSSSQPSAPKSATVVPGPGGKGATPLTLGAASSELGQPTASRCPPLIEAGVGAGQWAPEAARQWPIRKGFACRVGGAPRELTSSGR